MAGLKRRKRKGWAAVVFAVAAVMILGAGTCFAYPYIETVLSPKTQVLTAFKEAGEDCKMLTEQMLDEITGLLTGQTQFTGEVTVTQAEWDGTDYLEEIGLDKAEFYFYTNAQEQSVSGTIKMEGDSLNHTREDTFSLDKKKLKELLEASGYGYLYQDIDTLLNSVDADTMKEYMEVAQKLTKHLQSGIAATLEQSIYVKNGKEALEIAGEQVHTTSYTVTITKEALLAGVETFLDQVYADSELSSYTTMFATFTGHSRYDLSRKAEEMFAQMQGIEITVYLNSDKKLVRAATAFDTDFSYIIIETQGKEHWNEQIRFCVETQQSILTILRNSSDGKESFDINLRYHQEDQESYGAAVLKLEKENQNIVCKEGSFVMKYNGHQASAAFMGECTYQLYADSLKQ